MCIHLDVDLIRGKAGAWKGSKLYRYAIPISKLYDILDLGLTSTRRDAHLRYCARGVLKVRIFGGGRRERVRK